MLFIDKTGRVDAERVIVKIFPNIERGPMDKVNGIVVHQTQSPTAESTFNSYRGKTPHGAHFLIDKDGTVYQTASLSKRTNHVGRLRSRCIETCNCSPAELRVAMEKAKEGRSPLSIHEHKKPWTDRYPSNNDSIGIELVGMAYPPTDPKQSKEPIYEKVTEAQNASLQWLINELIATLSIAPNAIQRHSRISYKNLTEAATARW